MDYLERLKKNNNYYNRHISAVGTRSEKRDFSKALNFFLDNINYGLCVLDIGCGTGNHLEYFAQKGLNAIGIEPSPEMRKLCESRNLKVIDGCFENLPNLSNVGGIWCAASLLHVPKEDFFKTMQSLHALLEPDGRLYFTVRLGDKSKWDRYDDSDNNAERFIQLYPEDELINTTKNSGFHIVETWIEDSYWGRPSQWFSLVATKRKNSSLSET